MWHLSILILLVLLTYVWLKDALNKGFASYEENFKETTFEYDTLLRENERIKSEVVDLEKITADTIVLYDITKEICKSLDVDKVFSSFKQEITKYVKVSECKFLKYGTDLSAYTDYAVVPINIDNTSIGYLAVSDIQKEDKGKFFILVQQLLLGLKRAFLYQKVQELAISDSLTGAFSRRYCLERLNEELERSKKFKYKFSLLLVDVDHYKGYNDRYGHLVGDGILREISKTIKENIRQIDLIGRYGGDEFLIILTETDKKHAKFAAERIREAIEYRQMKVYDEDLKVTISIGISTFLDDTQEALALIEKADSALYYAKHTGRNRVYP